MEAADLSAAQRKKREQQIRSSITNKLEETGERERLEELLRTKLIESGWRDELKAYCKGRLCRHGATAARQAAAGCCYRLILALVWLALLSPPQRSSRTRGRRRSLWTTSSLRSHPAVAVRLCSALNVVD
jgi:hypothetical protein